jgi:hypothetical protein
MNADTILALLGALLGTSGVGGAIAYVWRERESFYKAQIVRMEAEIRAGRERIDRLQDAALASTLAAAEATRLEMTTYQRLARSFEEQNLLLKEALKDRK